MPPPSGSSPGPSGSGAEEARQAQEREKAEGRRRQRQQEARLQAVDAYLQRLTPTERTALEAEVLSRADPEARRGYEEAPARLRATMLLGLVREHVAEGLSRSAIPAG
jgi:hypothetical protein